MPKKKQQTQMEEAPTNQVDAPVPTDETEGTAGTEVKATDKKSGATVTVRYNFGKDLEAAATLFGEEVVFQYFQAAAVIRLQNLLRGSLAKGDTAAKAAELAASWRPGITRRGGGRKAKDPLDALMEKVASGELSVDDLKALIEARLSAVAA